MTPGRWYDIEKMFRMWASEMSEIFWEQVEGFMEAQGNLLTTFRTELMVERADLYY